MMAAGTLSPAPVGIIGIGGLGTLAVQFAKALGLRVVAIDNRAEGRELATAFDLRADLVVDPAEADATDTIKSWSGRDGLAAVIGVAAPLGLPPSGFSFDALDLVFNEITIKGSLVSNRVQAEDMLQTVARHGIKSHLKVLTMTDGPRLPDLYMDKHLRGRLVMKIA